MALYNLHEPLTFENWEYISREIQHAYSDPAYHLRVLKEFCHYQWILEDADWNPGTHLGHPELFRPSLRINPFHYGYSLVACDHNGNNPLILYNQSKPIFDIEEYIQLVWRVIQRKKQEGCVALKLSIAYARDLDFSETSKESAQVALFQGEEASPDEIRHFQDYIFFEICHIAAKLGLSIQVHTGLGIIKKTNAMQLVEVIEKNPATHFVLLHCSYPWLADTPALLIKFPNTSCDLAWLPLLSITATKILLHELLELGFWERIAWGCDTFSAEESYGARLAFHTVLSNVMAEKVKQGFYSSQDACQVMDAICYRNPSRIYHMEGTPVSI